MTDLNSSYAMFKQKQLRGNYEATDKLQKQGSEEKLGAEEKARSKTVKARQQQRTILSQRHYSTQGMREMFGAEEIRGVSCNLYWRDFGAALWISAVNLRD